MSECSKSAVLGSMKMALGDDGAGAVSVTCRVVVPESVLEMIEGSAVKSPHLPALEAFLDRKSVPFAFKKVAYEIASDVAPAELCFRFDGVNKVSYERVKKLLPTAILAAVIGLVESRLTLRAALAGISDVVFTD